MIQAPRTCIVVCGNKTHCCRISADPKPGLLSEQFVTSSPIFSTLCKARAPQPLCEQEAVFTYVPE